MMYLVHSHVSVSVRQHNAKLKGGLALPHPSAEDGWAGTPFRLTGARGGCCHLDTQATTH